MQNSKFQAVLDQFQRVVDLFTRNPQKYINRGDTQLTTGDHVGALKAYRRALELNPENADAYIGIGMVYRAQGKYPQAIEQFQQVIRLAPQSPAGYGNSGDAYFDLAKYEEALNSYAKAIELAPEMSIGYRRRADVYAAQGNNEEALKSYRQALDKDPKDVEAHYSIGKIFELQGQYEQALEHFHQVVELVPNNPIAYVARGNVHLALQRFSSALLDYDRVIELAPEATDGYWGRARVYEAQGAYEETIAELDKLIELEPTISQNYNARAEMYFNRKQYKTAYEDYKVAADLAHNLDDAQSEIQALVGQALCFYWIEEPVELLIALEKILVLNPENAWALQFKGEMLAEFAYYEEASRVLQQAISIDPSNDASFLSLGWAFENMGAAYFSDARQAYEKAIALNNDNLWAHKGRANALELLQDVDKAKEEYTYVVDQIRQRNMEGAYDKSLAGWCYYLLKQYEEAEKSYEEGLALDPTMFSAWFDLALVQICKGDSSQAYQTYCLSMEKIKSKHSLKRRGLIFIGLEDLNQAIGRQPQLDGVKEVQDARNLLDSAWEDLRDTQLPVPVPPA